MLDRGHFRRGFEARTRAARMNGSATRVVVRFELGNFSGSWLLRSRNEKFRGIDQHFCKENFAACLCVSFKIFIYSSTQFSQTLHILIFTWRVTCLKRTARDIFRLHRPRGEIISVFIRDNEKSRREIYRCSK